MAKIGRNEPCPCGSGSKYKKCCGRQPSQLTLVPQPATEATAPPFGRMGMERTLADIASALGEHEFASPEEADARVEEILSAGGPPRRRPASPVERAQAVMYDAWEAEGAERVKLARKALAISPDCADAYVLLAEETAPTLDEAIDLYQQGVAAGEHALGKEGFDEYAGHFWGVVETRPYMRARLGLAQCLWEAGRRQDAIEHYRVSLRLNPGDNQGVRYLLLACLLESGDRPGARELLDRYPDDIAASWAYGRTLQTFMGGGDTKQAREALAKASRVNRHVPAYLVGEKPLPTDLPDRVGFGDQSEAICAAAEQLVAWRATPGALAWLSAQRSEEGNVPRQARPYFEALVHLTDAVCREHLNQEYAQLCRRLATALCRKRPPPVTRGRIETWACAIVYTIGSVNFLFDKTQVPHLTAGELCALFGVSPSTGAARASEIRKMFRMGQFDPAWCLPSKLDQNPLAWMIMVDGLIVDARHAPRGVQEEALRLGLIPYLP